MARILTKTKDMPRKEILAVAKPILFNTDMVRAIQDGTKTVTRRVIKLKYGNTHIEWHKDKYGRVLVEMQNDVEGETYGVRPDGTHYQKILAMREIKPKYKVGDILYAREAWNTKGGIVTPKSYIYKADDENGCWKPSIHMPKEAARIFLRVTDVHVERLQDINERGKSSAAEEGFVNDIDLMGGTGKSAVRHFADVWDSTIKKSDLAKYGWAANPWVWVIEFERLEVSE